MVCRFFLVFILFHLNLSTFDNLKGDGRKLNLDKLVDELRLKLNPVGHYQDKFYGQLKRGILKLAPKVFILYLEENNLSYTAAEQKERYKIFEESFKNVLFHDDAYWKKGINKFSDKSETEREGYLGYNRSRTLAFEVAGTASPDIAETNMIVSGRARLGWPLYPKSKVVDWRNRGAMTVPLDQGDCGICWAFASTSVVESLYFIKTGVLRSMSVQQVADCTYSTNGCAGGWFGDVYSYILHSNKLASSSSYPLNLPTRGATLTVNRGCDYRKVRASEDAIKAAYLSQYASARSEEGIVTALSRHPVTAGIHAGDSLFAYKSGVYLDRSCPSSLDTNNHAVVLAGYTDSTFLVKNSWGESWGEGGYFRLNREGPNCGITTDVVWPTLYTYADRDPDSRYKPCQDTQPWCRNFAVVACPHSAPFRKICPYSCSTCSCRDLEEGCADKIHLCNTNSTVRWQCRRSCELCYCPPGTSLCKTRCLPYWDPDRRNCDSSPTRNSEFEV